MDALIAGAAGGIGFAATAQLCQDTRFSRVFALARGAAQRANLQMLGAAYPQLVLIDWDASQPSGYSAVAVTLRTHQAQLRLVLNTVGVLHTETMQPEKMLSQLNAEALMHSFQTNAVSAILLAQAVKPFFIKTESAVFASLSARVGSISDNQLGGWYSYRAAKAAHNMLLKTLSIEWQRSLKNVAVLALHPGTTDTALSKPFSANVPAGKLFTAEWVASQLLEIAMRATPLDTGQFLDYGGKQVAW